MIDSKTKEEIIELIRTGKSHREIASMMGVSVGSVSHVRNGGIINGDNDLPPAVEPTSTGFVCGDWQVPFHDEQALGLALDFCKRLQPDWIDLEGDIIDFYQLSRFDKNPGRVETLQTDINILKELITRLRSDNPKARIYYHWGNHEDRLRRLLWREAKGLASLDCLKIEKLLGLSEIDIKWLPEWRKEGDLYLMHGNIVRKESGYSAKAMYDKYGASIIHGHTHRDGKYTKRTLDGNKCVWENYCLCRLDPEYDPFPNWTQGFSKVTMIGRRPFVEQIPIIGGKYIYEGKLYK